MTSSQEMWNLKFFTRLQLVVQMQEACCTGTRTQRSSLLCSPLLSSRPLLSRLSFPIYIIPSVCARPADQYQELSRVESTQTIGCSSLQHFNKDVCGAGAEGGGWVRGDGRGWGAGGSAHIRAHAHALTRAQPDTGVENPLP